MEIDRNPQKCKEKSSLSELLLIGTLKFLSRSYLFLSVLSFNSNPLLSVIISFYCLILLYLPHLFLYFLCSPVLISTAVLLATLLHLGSSQREKVGALLPETQKQDLKHEEIEEKDATDLGLPQREKDSILPSKIEEMDREDESAKWVASEKAVTEMGLFQNAEFSEMFMEWDRSGPLEVIYEDYEGEEEEDSPEKTLERERWDVGVDGFVCSSFCYPDSDSSEGEFPAWDSPENLCFRWEESEGLIEIPLTLKPTVRFEAEEENLIEINLFDGRK